MLSASRLVDRRSMGKICGHASEGSLPAAMAALATEIASPTARHATATSSDLDDPEPLNVLDDRQALPPLDIVKHDEPPEIPA